MYSLWGGCGLIIKRRLVGILAWSMSATKLHCVFSGLRVASYPALLGAGFVSWSTTGAASRMFLINRNTLCDLSEP